MSRGYGSALRLLLQERMAVTFKMRQPALSINWATLQVSFDWFGVTVFRFLLTTDSVTMISTAYQKKAVYFATQENQTQ